jgi:hypothetical protein
MMMDLWVALLGPPAVERDGRPVSSGTCRAVALPEIWTLVEW